MHSALTVVNDAIHVAQRPASVIGGGGDVARVRAAHCIAAVHRIIHGAINDFAGEAAVAHSDILMVPLRGQPEFKAEFGKNRADDAAKAGTERGAIPPAPNAPDTGVAERTAIPGSDSRVQFLAALGLG